MYQGSVRQISQPAARSARFLNTSLRPTKRFLSTAPPTQKRRTWKSSFARLTLAAGAVYYYNTSDVFAEEPQAAIRQLDESIHNIAESNQPTLDAILEEKKRRRAERVAEELRKEQTEAAAAAAVSASTLAEEAGAEDDEMGNLEEEADQQGAFNPETGEINWDCPCLGGMAHGPCGEEFKAAFSCFVYSNEEPKGVECIDKFKGMQDCFRQHPEMYGSELEDDEEVVEAELHTRDNLKVSLDSERDEPAAIEPTKPPISTDSETHRVASEGKDGIPAVSITGSPSDAAPSATSRTQGQTPKEASRDGPPATGSSIVSNTTNTAEKGRDQDGDLTPKAAHDESVVGNSTVQ